VFWPTLLAPGLIYAQGHCASSDGATPLSPSGDYVVLSLSKWFNKPGFLAISRAGVGASLRNLVCHGLSEKATKSVRSRIKAGPGRQPGWPLLRMTSLAAEVAWHCIDAVTKESGHMDVSGGRLLFDSGL